LERLVVIEERQGEINSGERWREKNRGVHEKRPKNMKY
jgi:hypothetical protein